MQKYYHELRHSQIPSQHQSHLVKAVIPTRRVRVVSSSNNQTDTYQDQQALQNSNQFMAFVSTTCHTSQLLEPKQTAKNNKNTPLASNSKTTDINIKGQNQSFSQSYKPPNARSPLDRLKKLRILLIHQNHQALAPSKSTKLNLNHNSLNNQRCLLDNNTIDVSFTVPQKKSNPGPVRDPKSIPVLNYFTLGDEHHGSTVKAPFSFMESHEQQGFKLFNNNLKPQTQQERRRKLSASHTPTNSNRRSVQGRSIPSPSFKLARKKYNFIESLKQFSVKMASHKRKAIQVAASYFDNANSPSARKHTTPVATPVFSKFFIEGCNTPDQSQDSSQILFAGNLDSKLNNKKVVATKRSLQKQISISAYHKMKVSKAHSFKTKQQVAQGIRTIKEGVNDQLRPWDFEEQDHIIL